MHWRRYGHRHCHRITLTSNSQINSRSWRRVILLNEWYSIYILNILHIYILFLQSNVLLLYFLSDRI